MNYIHVFLHIKSVASHASVYLMAAVIRTEAQQSFMPAPFRFYSVVYLLKYGYIRLERNNRLSTLRRPAVHRAVIVTVIERDEIVFI